MLEPLGDTGEHDGLAAGACVKSGGLRNEGFADARRPDQHQWPRVLEPGEALDLFDLWSADRSLRREVEVFERGAVAELGGFDSIRGLARLTVIDFPLHHLIEQLAAP